MSYIFTMKHFVLAVLLLVLGTGTSTASNVEIFQGGSSSMSSKEFVNYTSCGGVGTVRQVTADNCVGPSCELIPGDMFEFEIFLFPGMASPSLTLVIDAVIVGGFRISIMSFELPNSSIEPGVPVTVRFTIVLNDLLVRQDWIMEVMLRHTHSEIEEFCVRIDLCSITCVNP